jgi:hypothetical protein
MNFLTSNVTTKGNAVLARTPGLRAILQKPTGPAIEAGWQKPRTL